MDSRVVVTGAGGFVGRATCATLLQAGYAVRALARRNFTLPGGQTSAPLTIDVVEDLATADSLDGLLAGADAIVHLAARVHRLSETASVAVHAYDRDVQMTKALAQAARRAGVRRFVYLSSVKALADRSDVALARAATPNPVDAYGRSKLEAERQLAAISASTGLPVVVIRSPLVYGAGAGANFRQLVRWVARGVPLPLAGVQNRRSIVSIDNLADFILRCLGAIDETFSLYHVSDPEPVSTPELVRHVATGLALKPHLFSVRTSLLESLCALVGKSDVAVRLLMSLELETQDSFAALAWQPCINTREGICRAVRGMKI